jgi:purine-binding chemotaxis protein CheW
MGRNIDLVKQQRGEDSFMSKEKNRHISKTGLAATAELAIFHVGDMTCALKSIEVQEIIKGQEITKVHHAPAYVKGVINLRGQIVTIISMRKKFNFSQPDNIEAAQIVIVKMGDENVGLLVDSVDDILIAKVSDIEKPPSNLRGLKGSFFNGIYKKNDALVAVLNIEEILKLEE